MRSLADEARKNSVELFPSHRPPILKLGSGEVKGHMTGDVIGPGCDPITGRLYTLLDTNLNGEKIY